jgi:hypothetical protein
MKLQSPDKRVALYPVTCVFTSSAAALLVIQTPSSSCSWFVLAALVTVGWNVL